VARARQIKSDSNWRDWIWQKQKLAAAFLCGRNPQLIQATDALQQSAKLLSLALR
jgi:fibrillarin-like rRNA methylase